MISPYVKHIRFSLGWMNYEFWRWKMDEDLGTWWWFNRWKSCWIDMDRLGFHQQRLGFHHVSHDELGWRTVGFHEFHGEQIGIQQTWWIEWWPHCDWQYPVDNIYINVSNLQEDQTLATCQAEVMQRWFFRPCSGRMQGESSGRASWPSRRWFLMIRGCATWFTTGWGPQDS